MIRTETLLQILIGLGIFFAISITCVINQTLPPLSNFLKQRGDDDIIIYFHIITIGSLLWPFIWYFVIGLDIIKECPILIIAFLWPILLGLIQLIDVYYDKCEDIQDFQQQRMVLIGGIHTDASTLISFSFALASLLWVLRDQQNPLPSARIVVMALLLCIGFIVPTYHFMDNNQRYTTFIRVAQRVCVNYAMGFIITALIMVLSVCVKK
jgi:hypothetical protein